MFEKASRMKLRFPYKGLCTAEDLWDLTVQELDSIYKFLNSRLKVAQEESLLNTRSREDVILALQIEVLKYIVGVKVAEAQAKEEAQEKRAEKKKLLDILSAKQDAALQGLSEEEIKTRIEALG